MKELELINYLRAGFTLFWLETDEPSRVKQNFYQKLEDFKLKNGSHYKSSEWSCLKDANPMQPLVEIDSADEYTVMFCFNYHWFIDRPQVIQKIQDSIPIWASENKAIVIVSNRKKIPIELEKDFTILKMPMPTEDEISEQIKTVAPDSKYVPQGSYLEKVVKTSKGLTLRELENVYALSLVKKKRFDLEVINDYRAQTIEKSGFATILRPDITFDDIIGLENPKEQVMSTIDNPKSKGVCFIGPPGTGKTCLAKAIVAESGKLGIQVRMGKFFSKFQGETDANIEKFIDLVTALGDCFILFDEMEKQFAGAGSTGDLDSGVTRRATGRWLEFLQDRPKGIYIAATFNSFRGVPPEYLRAGRWDCAPFFVDLPNDKVKRKILDYYIKKFSLPKPKTIPKMEDWTGAEIEALCHNADMRNVSLTKASKFILPMALTMEEEITELRVWAKGRTIPADIPTSATKHKVKSRKLEII